MKINGVDSKDYVKYLSRGYIDPSEIKRRCLADQRRKEELEKRRKEEFEKRSGERNKPVKKGNDYDDR